MEPEHPLSVSTDIDLALVCERLTEQFPTAFPLVRWLTKSEPSVVISGDDVSVAAMAAPGTWQPRPGGYLLVFCTDRDPEVYHRLLKELSSRADGCQWLPDVSRRRTHLQFVDDRVRLMSCVTTAEDNRRPVEVLLGRYQQTHLSCGISGDDLLATEACREVMVTGISRLVGSQGHAHVVDRSLRSGYRVELPSDALDNLGERRLISYLGGPVAEPTPHYLYQWTPADWSTPEKALHWYGDHQFTSCRLWWDYILYLSPDHEGYHFLINDEKHSIAEWPRLRHQWAGRMDRLCYSLKPRLKLRTFTHGQHTYLLVSRRGQAPLVTRLVAGRTMADRLPQASLSVVEPSGRTGLSTSDVILLNPEEMTELREYLGQ